MPGSSDFDLDGEPVEREGHETLLPSVTRSVLSRSSYVASELEAAATGSVAPMVDADIETTPIAKLDARPRGARPGDVIGSR